MNNGSIVDHILHSEGWPTFTNHPQDRGGPTKGGITLKTLQSYGNRPSATEADLRNLTEVEARKIYEKSYIIAPGFALIKDDLLRFQVVDAGVLSGTSRATRWLQEVVGAVVDGRMGPVTASAVNSGDAHTIALKFCAARARGLMRIVSKDPSQAVWASGWMNRAMGFLDREADRPSL
jgi:lysozyme family protein